MTVFHRSVTALALAVLTAACARAEDKGASSDKGAADPAAATAQAPKATEATAAAGQPAPTTGEMARAGVYTIDPDHSFVLFKVRHFGVGYAYGEFNDVKGSFEVGADPTQSKVEITLATDSIDTHVAKRDAHLKSPDFFNAAQFPEITFRSTKVSAPGADGWSTVTGDLTIRGKTRSVDIQVRPVGAGNDPMNTYRVGFEAKGLINRMDYDVSFMKGALGDEVELILAFEGTPKA